MLIPRDFVKEIEIRYPEFFFRILVKRSRLRISIFSMDLEKKKRFFLDIGALRPGVKQEACFAINN